MKNRKFRTTRVTRGSAVLEVASSSGLLGKEFASKVADCDEDDARPFFLQRTQNDDNDRKPDDTDRRKLPQRPRTTSPGRSAADLGRSEVFRSSQRDPTKSEQPSTASSFDEVSWTALSAATTPSGMETVSPWLPTPGTVAVVKVSRAPLPLVGVPVRLAAPIDADSEDRVEAKVEAIKRIRLRGRTNREDSATGPHGPGPPGALSDVHYRWKAAAAEGEYDRYGYPPRLSGAVLYETFNEARREHNDFPDLRPDFFEEALAQIQRMPQSAAAAAMTGELGGEEGAAHSPSSSALALHKELNQMLKELRSRRGLPSSSLEDLEDEDVAAKSASKAPAEKPSADDELIQLRDEFRVEDEEIAVYDNVMGALISQVGMYNADRARLLERLMDGYYDIIRRTRAPVMQMNRMLHEKQTLVEQLRARISDLTNEINLLKTEVQVRERQLDTIRYSERQAKHKIDELFQNLSVANQLRDEAEQEAVVAKDSNDTQLQIATDLKIRLSHQTHMVLELRDTLEKAYRSIIPIEKRNEELKKENEMLARNMETKVNEEVIRRFETELVRRVEVETTVRVQEELSKQRRIEAESRRREQEALLKAAQEFSSRKAEDGKKKRSKAAAAARQQTNRWKKVLVAASMKKVLGVTTSAKDIRESGSHLDVKESKSERQMSTPILSNTPRDGARTEGGRSIRGRSEEMFKWDPVTEKLARILNEQGQEAGAEYEAGFQEHHDITRVQARRTNRKQVVNFSMKRPPTSSSKDSPDALAARLAQSLPPLDPQSPDAKQPSPAGSNSAGAGGSAARDAHAHIEKWRENSAGGSADQDDEKENTSRSRGGSVMGHPRSAGDRDRDRDTLHLPRVPMPSHQQSLMQRQDSITSEAPYSEGGARRLVPASVQSFLSLHSETNTDMESPDTMSDAGSEDMARSEGLAWEEVNRQIRVLQDLHRKLAPYVTGSNGRLDSAVELVTRAMLVTELRISGIEAATGLRVQNRHDELERVKGEDERLKIMEYQVLNLNDRIDRLRFWLSNGADTGVPVKIGPAGAEKYDSCVGANLGPPPASIPQGNNAKDVYGNAHSNSSSFYGSPNTGPGSSPAMNLNFRAQSPIRADVLPALLHVDKTLRDSGLAGLRRIGMQEAVGAGRLPGAQQRPGRLLTSSNASSATAIKPALRQKAGTDAGRMSPEPDADHGEHEQQGGGRSSSGMARSRPAPWTPMSSGGQSRFEITSGNADARPHDALGVRGSGSTVFVRDIFAADESGDEVPAAGAATTGQNKRSLRWLLRIIRTILDEKALFEMSTRHDGQARTALSVFVRDWLQTRYGLASIVDETLQHMREMCEEHRGHNMEVLLFYQFLNATHSIDHLSFFLYCRMLVEAVLSSDSRSLQISYGYAPIDLIYGVAARVFGTMDPETRDGFMQTVDAAAVTNGQGASRPDMPLINVQRFLHLALLQYKDEQNRFEVRITDLFNQLDDSHDGKIGWASVPILIKNIAPQYSLDQVQEWCESGVGGRENFQRLVTGGEKVDMGRLCSFIAHIQIFSRLFQFPHKLEFSLRAQQPQDNEVVALLYRRWVQFAPQLVLIQRTFHKYPLIVAKLSQLANLENRFVRAIQLRLAPEAFLTYRQILHMVQGCQFEYERYHDLPPVEAIEQEFTGMEQVIITRQNYPCI